MLFALLACCDNLLACLAVHSFVAPQVCNAVPCYSSLGSHPACCLMTLYEPAHCNGKQMVHAGLLTGWGISQGPSLGDRIKKTNNKAVQADPIQFLVRYADLFAVIVSITCFIGCLKAYVKHLFCIDYAIMTGMPRLA